MASPWYEQYFTADYWAYAVEEYDDARTAAEVDYLAAVLAREAPGRRVLDIGCGIGRHAIGLARHGFEMTGVDISEVALSRAAHLAAEADVSVRLERADVLAAPGWAVGTVDAVICVQAFGWGTDEDQLRLLRQIRQRLAPGGVLILDHSNILAIAAIYQPEASTVINGTEFHFSRRYDPIGGRSYGEVRVRRPDGTSTSLPDNVRMYQPAEIRQLLTRAGFSIAATDAGFTVGAPVTLNTRYVQFIAKPRATIESALTGHQQPTPAGGLDLRWAPDEVEFVADALAGAWVDLADDGIELADRARRYDLTDPYGAQRATPVLAAHVQCDLAPPQVNVGAGATGLLHDLARLASGGTVLIDPVGHPHLAATAETVGVEIRVSDLTDVADAVTAVQRYRPAVTVIDRPGLRGRYWPIESVRVLAEAVAATGGVLIVDETCGSYAAPDTSAAALTAEVDRLVVLRSMSKGYCSGGLRIGFAISSPRIAAVVRSILSPLAASAVSLDVALALLRRPDPLAPLRDRIAEAKPAAEAALAAAGITAAETDPQVPWMVLPATAEIRALMIARGLIVKDVPVRHPDGSASALLRMAVPLSAARRKALDSAMSDIRVGMATDAPR